MLDTFLKEGTLAREFSEFCVEREAAVELDLLVAVRRHRLLTDNAELQKSAIDIRDRFLSDNAPVFALGQKRDVRELREAVDGGHCTAELFCGISNDVEKSIRDVILDFCSSEAYESYHKLSPAARRISSLAGNGACADCGAASPQWASVHFGSAICLQCSGVHRGLGVHMTLVQCLTLDQWSTENEQHMLQAGGNAAINAVLEKHLADHPHCKKKPLPKDSMAFRSWYIKAKYIDKEFASLDGTSTKTSPPTCDDGAPVQWQQPHFSGILSIHLVGGKHLPAMDTNGSSDPFVEFFSDSQGPIRSAIVKASLSPYWDEHLSICVQDTSKPLVLKCYDWDQFCRNDFIGEAEVDLTQVTAEKTSIWVPLFKHKAKKAPKEKKLAKEKAKASKRKPKYRKPRSAGSIHLYLSFQELSC